MNNNREHYHQTAVKAGNSGRLSLSNDSCDISVRFTLHPQQFTSVHRLLLISKHMEDTENIVTTEIAIINEVSNI